MLSRKEWLIAVLFGCVAVAIAVLFGRVAVALTAISSGSRQSVQRDLDWSKRQAVALEQDLTQCTDANAWFVEDLAVLRRERDEQVKQVAVLRAALAKRQSPVMQYRYLTRRFDRE